MMMAHSNLLLLLVLRLIGVVDADLMMMMGLLRRCGGGLLQSEVVVEMRLP